MRHFLLPLMLLLVSCGQLELTDSPADNPSAADTSGPDTETLPSETIFVSSFPTPCSIWQNHVVALVLPIQRAPVPEAQASGNAPAPTEALVTLISLYDWADLPSALNVDNPTLVAIIAQSYQEYDLSDWRIPTTAEAKALRAAYPAPVPEDSSSGITALNALLLQAEGLPLSSSVRYLCDEATRSFSFSSGTTISAAGTKATTYRLRLVKTLRLKLKQ